MSNQDKPTTGEWTEQTVNKLLNVIASPHLQRQNVADAHKACRALLKVPDDEVLYVAIQELQEQLDIERSKPKTTEYAQGWDDHVVAVRPQLEQLAGANNERLAAIAQGRELERKLAAAQAAIRELTGDLADFVASECDFHAIDASKWWKAILRARKLDTVAQVKEGK